MLGREAAGEARHDASRCLDGTRDSGCLLKLRGNMGLDCFLMAWYHYLAMFLTQVMTREANFAVQCNTPDRPSPLVCSSRVRPVRRSFEHVQPERQDAAEPRGMFGVIGIIIASARMKKNCQAIAVKHEPRQQ